MTPRLPLLLGAGLTAASALGVAASPRASAATDPADRAITATWTGDGTVSSGWLLVPTVGDRYVTVSGPVTPLRGASGTCSASWLEDPSGVPYGVVIGLTTYLACDGGVAHWSGGCVVTRYATIRLACTAADGAVVEAELAYVPEAAFTVYRFTFAGTLTRVKPV